MKQQSLWLAALLLSADAAAAPQPIVACKTLSASGSYELSKNLTADGDCLILAADGITINLAGYTMTGNGTGSAIKTDSQARRAITVHNGNIRNFESGVDLAYTGVNVRIEKLAVLGVFGTVGTGTGIGANDSSIVIDNIVSHMGIGFMVGSRSIVRGNTANFNFDGFNLNLSTVVGNMAGNNSRDGFQCQGGTIVNNFAFASGRYGFLRQGGNYLGNTATLNVTDVDGAANNSEHNVPGIE